MLEYDYSYPEVPRVVVVGGEHLTPEYVDLYKVHLAPHQQLAFFHSPEEALKHLQSCPSTVKRTVISQVFGGHQGYTFFAKLEASNPEVNRVLISNQTAGNFARFDEMAQLANHSFIIGEEWLPENPQNPQKLRIDCILNS